MLLQLKLNEDFAALQDHAIEIPNSLIVPNKNLYAVQCYKYGTIHGT